MGKIKETAGKVKNKSTALAATKEDPADRAAREQAIMSLSQMGEAGYEQIEEEAQGELHELEVVEKEALVGMPLVVIDVKENESKDNTDPETGEYQKYLFVTVFCNDGKVRAFTDGGSGIRGQIGGLIGVVDPRNPATFVKCPGGLKPSKPYKNSVNGAMTVTWRLAQHEKAEKSLRAAPTGNSRATARA